VRGADFALLYDAGSKEDIGRNKRNRVLEFMRERHPDLERLDHVVLSHPHRDHVNLLDEVLERYEVGNIWDVGLLHPVCPYLRFLRAVSEEKGASYRSAARGPGPLRLGFDESPCERDEALPENRYLVVHGPKLKTGEKVRLGRDVVMTFLHVDPRDKKDPNENSLVVRIDVAGKRILLMGDAKAGERVHPRYKPDKDSTEGRLLRDSPGKIKADVMVVGHHGSHTSSRTAFLDAVGAKTFIVSVGMAALDGYALPNPDVIEALEKRGRVLRTDARDRKCLKSRRKVGKGDDGMVGGCDNIRVVVFEDEKREPDFEIYPRRL
jgi:competence protein ComEC